MRPKKWLGQGETAGKGNRPRNVEPRKGIGQTGRFRKGAGQEGSVRN